MEQNSLSIEGLEQDYDVVVLGTNLSSSIVAGAAGFSHHSVLHLDANDFYGHLDDATFSFDQALNWATQMENHQSKSQSIENFEEGGDDLTLKKKVHEALESYRGDQSIDDQKLRIVRMNQNPAMCAHLFSVGGGYNNISSKEEEHVEVNKPKQQELEVNKPKQQEPDNEENVEIKENALSLEKIKASSRRFCIDMGNPMAIFANGTSVDLMVTSGVGRYLEFLSMNSLNVFESTASWRVPCSKRDIFSSKELSVMEKNKLMKLLRFVMDWGVVNISGNIDLSTQDDVELKAGRSLNRPQNKGVASSDSSSIDLTAPFVDYLDTWNISKKLRDAIMYAIALLPEHSTNTFDGLAATFRHLSALNHYGSTALLAPLYGGGELSQAFCRLCAVSRGTYLLRHQLYGLVLEMKEDGVEEVVGICDGQGHVISTSRFVCCSDYLRRPIVWNEDTDLHHAWTVRRVCILDTPIAEGRSVTVIKPMTLGVLNEAPIFVIQCDESTESCPRGVGAYIVQLTTTAHVGMSSTEAAAALDRAAGALAASSGAFEIWHLCFGLPLGGTDDRIAGKDGTQVRGAAVLERLQYSCDPHPIATQSKTTFEELFIDTPYFKQSDEEREEAARQRGEGDEEASALDDALQEDARQECLRAEALQALLVRVEKLEASDSHADQRIKTLEVGLLDNRH